jgi:GNAT superfamily N-acetyltransferase
VSSAVRLVPSSRFATAELAALFTASFEDYVVPLTVDEAGFRGMAQLFDIDLDASRVALSGEAPVGLVNLGLRGDRGRIGGMGVVRNARRGGVGETLMHAAHESAAARGVTEIWLEAITTNAAAIRLYEKLGYEHVRDLEIWELEAEPPAATAGETTPAEAHERVRELRTAREPWQRADETVAHLLGSGTLLGLVNGGGAAVVRRGSANSSLEQLAAASVDAAVDLIAAALARCRPLRVANFPAGGEAARALTRFGAAPRICQHELRLVLR